MPPRQHMKDECEVGTFDVVSGGVEPVEAWTYGETIRCRFLRRSTREVVDGDRHETTDAAIHVPSGTTITNSSRFKVLKRNGRVLSTVEYYDVKGEPWETEGNRVIVCDCQTVPVGAE